MSDYPIEPSRPDQWLRVDVRGNDKKLWALLHEKFVDKINRLLQATLDYERGTTVRDEMREFSSALLDFAKAKLARAGLEDEKIAAEISKMFAERQAELAKADKTSEEARQLRIQNDISELRLTLGATKAMLIGDESEEAVLFGKQLDTFLDVLKELAGAAPR
jgi:hypothetical protein